MNDLAAFIILTSNTTEFTKKCVESIKKETNYKNYKIIVVDNGSNNDEGFRLCQINGVDKLIELDSNKGFAGGMNEGIKMAMKLQAEYMFLINCDVVVSKNWATNMIKCSKETDSGIVGCLSNYICEEEQQIQSYNNKTPNRYINISVKPDSFIVFLVVLLTRATIKKVGYLDEMFYPINYEDNDYSMRAKINGINLKIDGFTYIWHNPGSVPTQRVVKNRDETFKRNRELYHNKWKEEREPVGLGI